MNLVVLAFLIREYLSWGIPLLMTCMVGNPCILILTSRYTLQLIPNIRNVQSRYHEHSMYARSQIGYREVASRAGQSSVCGGCSSLVITLLSLRIIAKENT